VREVYWALPGLLAGRAGPGEPPWDLQELWDRGFRAIASKLEVGRPTLVHCRQGRDRTGSVLGAYLMRHRGLAPDEAVRRVRKANPQAMISAGFDRLPWLFADLEVPGR
jgi:protein-tyrosine phosphatase